MKMSQLFGRTLREHPSGAETDSFRLLIRAGFIHPVGAGIYAYLPLAIRTINKLEFLMRSELENIGGQEFSMPAFNLAEIWTNSSNGVIGSLLKERKEGLENGDLILDISHQKMSTGLLSSEIRSYKQLPRLIYQFQTGWHQDSSPRQGLLRAHDFKYIESYSLDADIGGLERQYRLHYQTFFNYFHICGLEVIVAKSNNSGKSGWLGHKYIFQTPIGEKELIRCSHCGYTADRQAACFRKALARPEAMKSIQKVETPACKSIEELSNFLGVPRSKTAKAVFFKAFIPQGEELTQKLIFAVLRGDMELNEIKLANAIDALVLRPASRDEIKAVGAEPGFASPIGLAGKKKKGFLIVVDDSILSSNNLVAGANETDYHLLNTNYPRDYKADIVTDIATVDEGYACLECGNPMQMAHGLEVSNLIQLGSDYMDSNGCYFLDLNGYRKPVFMGRYRVDLNHLLACIAEAHHDEHGLVWPITVSPFQVYLVLLYGKTSYPAKQIADELYEDLQSAGVEVLYDDRDESPGVKFHDADLIGIPIRLTVSGRGLEQDSVEFKLRYESTKELLPLDQVVTRLQTVIKSLQDEIASRITQVPFPIYH